MPALAVALVAAAAAPGAGHLAGLVVVEAGAQVAVLRVGEHQVVVVAAGGDQRPHHKTEPSVPAKPLPRVRWLRLMRMSTRPRTQEWLIGTSKLQIDSALVKKELVQS